MTRKTYRTAMGKTVDLGALQLKNENVRAVGNMGVNARGDRVDGNNRPIDSRNRQVKSQYNRQTQQTNVSSEDVVTSSKPRTPAPLPTVEIPPTPEDFDDDFVKPEEPAAQTDASTGLRAAIAKARQIRQDPIEPPPVLQKKRGLNKI